MKRLILILAIVFMACTHTEYYKGATVIKKGSFNRVKIEYKGNEYWIMVPDSDYNSIHEGQVISYDKV